MTSWWKNSREGVVINKKDKSIFSLAHASNVIQYVLQCTYTLFVMTALFCFISCFFFCFVFFFFSSSFLSLGFGIPAIQITCTVNSFNILSG